MYLLVTGSHLSAEYGLTIKEIQGDGLPIFCQVDVVLSSGSDMGTAKGIGLATLGSAEYLQFLKPDYVFVVGDRYELLGVCAAALSLKIPILHAHGGEVTTGAMDEAIRHAISKMAYRHYVANKIYEGRLIRLGEQPESIVVTGGLGLDNLTNFEAKSLAKLESELAFRFGAKSALVTYHPETWGKNDVEEDIHQLLDALVSIPDLSVIFTLANADAGGSRINALIRHFCSKRPNAICVESLGVDNYFSCLKLVDLVIGNSSSGLLEVPCFKIPTVNIGRRQAGRLRATSVIDVDCNSQKIEAAIAKALSPNFRKEARQTINPYGAPGAAEKILGDIKAHVFKGVEKIFYDGF